MIHVSFFILRKQISGSGLYTEMMILPTYIRERMILLKDFVMIKIKF